MEMEMAHARILRGDCALIRCISREFDARRAAMKLSLKLHDHS